VIIIENKLMMMRILINSYAYTTSFSKLLSADLIVAGKNVYVTENNEQLICDAINVYQREGAKCAPLLSSLCPNNLLY